MKSFRLTREIPMWSGPRHSPVPVIAPAGEQRASHIPQDLPRPRAEGENYAIQTNDPRRRERLTSGARCTRTT